MRSAIDVVTEVNLKWLVDRTVCAITVNQIENFAQKIGAAMHITDGINALTRRDMRRRPPRV